MFKVEIKKDGVITNYSEFKTYVECEAWVLENHDYFPEGYVAEIINVTAEKSFAAAKSKGLKNQDIGRNVLAIIYAINDEKTKLGLLTPSILTALLQDPTLAIIERLLLNGSLGSAVSLITNIPDQFFNAENKELILDYIEKNK
jgi:hypothetical protein